MTQKVFWEPHPGPQTEALLRDEDEILYGGARGGGKTDTGMVWLLKYIKHPKYRFLVIRKNFQDLSDWVDRARELFKCVGGTVAGNPPVFKFPSGAIGRVGHLKDENAFTKYQGHEYHRMLIEELTHIPREIRYLSLISSCRTTIPELKPQIFCTANPGGAGHLWVKNRFISNERLDGSIVGAYETFVQPVTMRSRVFIPARVTDNPTIMKNDPGYYNYLLSLPDKLRKAWLEGNWDIFEGQFFNTWNKLVHVCAPFEIPEEWAKFIAVDYGYAAPSAALWFAVSPDGRTYQYRELYQTGLTYEDLRDKIVEMSGKERIDYGVVDPAMQARSQGTGVVGLEVLNDNPKIRFRPGDNDRINGWIRLREYYKIREDSEGKPYSLLTVFTICPRTIETVPELVHDAHKVEDLDSDGEDHCADTQRYFVMSRPRPRDPKDNFRIEAKGLDAHTYQYRLRKRLQAGENPLIDEWEDEDS